MEKENDLKIKETAEKISNLKEEIKKVIIWQDELINMLIIWLLADWHILLEGLPWLAKTLSVSTLSKTLDLGFNRVQFTPDLLPSDLVWTEIYNTKTNDFEIKKWPIFNNFILADEINRAPSKVQSALLEAMAEKHITIWKDSFALEKPFLVLATQNPIEQSGTYNLPEAELDRFLLKVKVSYPEKEEEKKMYKYNLWEDNIEVRKIFKKSEVLDLQKLTKEIFVADSIYDYVSDLVEASRNPAKYGLWDLEKYINYGVSPRWGLAIIKASKANALINGRSFVLPEDIQYLATKALAHRIVLSYEAIASEIDEYFIINKILEWVRIV